MTTDATGVYSIGHSVHSMDAFIELLKGVRIAAIADVRSAPYSRRQPQFNRPALASKLEESGIAYVFLGQELGGRGADESVRDENGRVRYGDIAETPAFRSGLKRVRDGSERMRIALLCAEGEPLDCHRAILVSRFLEVQGTPVTHIHADGRLEPHRDAEYRLLQLTGLQHPDLFRTEDEILADAYRRREEKISFVYSGARAAEGVAR